MSEADEQVVGRVLGGDPEAFALLVERYQRQVVALGLRFFRQREDAEDFTQEVFLQAYRRLNSFRHTGRFYSWLMRIAYNLGVRGLRRRPDYDSLGDLPVVGRDLSPSQTLERREARAAVSAAIRALPRRYADCVGLFYFFDLSYQEVSDVTGFPLNTVRSHIRRARLLLSERLSDLAEPPPSPGGTP